jgi:fructose-bisphosphate aldolase class II
MAHPVGVSVEGELGVLAGEEDEDTKSEVSTYTNPEELEEFLKCTGVLMLAPTIGTKHGPNKGKPGEKVKLNIPLAHELLKTANEVNDEIVFVAHGASTLYPNVVKFAIDQLKSLSDNSETIENWRNFVGTDWEQIQGLIGAGFCKINTDTENRQTFLAALIGAINKNASKVDIRYYDNLTTAALRNSYIQKLIMAGNYGIWHEPKIDIKSFNFKLD